MKRSMLRTILAATALTLSIGLPAQGASKQLDLNDPADALIAMRKLQCHLEDGKPAFYAWSGDVFARRRGEADKKLFKVIGMNVRACKTVDDPKSGKGFRLVSREILLYLDPVTGQVLRRWTNPWTGKELEVLHVANDPVNNSFGSIGRDGKPTPSLFTSIGNAAFVSFTVPLFYPNPLAGEYQPQVGGTYHATEMFNFSMDKDKLVSPKTKSADDAVISWTRLSQWLPWMEMGDREGILYFSTVGARVPDFEALHDTMKAEIRANFPIYAEAPPLDDPRRNETSWTYYKKVMEERRASAPKAN
jgi:hypothetical protein